MSHTAQYKTSYRKTHSFGWTLALLIVAELFFLFVALSVGSMAAKGILITIGVILVILNAGRLTRQ